MHITSLCSTSHSSLLSPSLFSINSSLLQEVPSSGLWILLLQTLFFLLCIFFCTTLVPFSRVGWSHCPSVVPVTKETINLHIPTHRAAFARLFIVHPPRPHNPYKDIVEGPIVWDNRFVSTFLRLFIAILPCKSIKGSHIFPNLWFEEAIQTVNPTTTPEFHLKTLRQNTFLRSPKRATG